jgi:diguanylate cyclase (GGDEF)-like protein/PAS domain S-box-containing protein
MRALLARDNDDRLAPQADVHERSHEAHVDRDRRDFEFDRDRLDFEGSFTFAPIGIALIGLDGRFLRVNPAFCQITGYAPEELLGKAVRDITHPDDVGADAEQVARLLAGETRSSQLEKRYINARGHVVWALVFRSLARDKQGMPQHFIAQVMDVSERKRFERELRERADRDPLTGLRNRRRFEEDLRQQLGRSQRYGEQAALLMIDLDGFKRLNDTRGHQAGDELLKAVASALNERLRATDLIARIGGDEFAVLLPHVDMRRAASVAGEIATAIADCSERVGERGAQVTASVGTAFIDRNAGSADVVLEQADQAMYATKHARQRSLPGSV